MTVPNFEFQRTIEHVALAGDWTSLGIHQGDNTQVGYPPANSNAPYRLSHLDPCGGQTMYAGRHELGGYYCCADCADTRMDRHYRQPYPISPHEHFCQLDNGVHVHEMHLRTDKFSAASALSPPSPASPFVMTQGSPVDNNSGAGSAWHYFGDGKRRREQSRRYRLAKSQILCLTQLFAVEPSPSGEVHSMVSNSTGVPRKAVRLWFQNTRARLRRDAKAAGISNLHTSADLRRFHRSQERKNGTLPSKGADGSSVVEMTQQLCNILSMYKEGRYGPVDRRNEGTQNHPNVPTFPAVQDNSGTKFSPCFESVDDDDESECDGAK
ncbi:hypothetical protein HDU83_008637 [Entophlyctis luteolus]|nr:hypothetical protein HDU83_008637 [Entophlyctis luteolus]